MKTIFFGAVALGALAVIGCTDDRALGQERMKDSAHFRPAQHDDVLHEPGQVQGQPAPDARMPSEAPDPEMRKAWSHDPTGARAASTPQVINGEDLAAIPDLTEPIWASGTSTVAPQRTPMDTKDERQIIGEPGEVAPPK